MTASEEFHARLSLGKGVQDVILGLLRDAVGHPDSFVIDDSSVAPTHVLDVRTEWAPDRLGVIDHIPLCTAELLCGDIAITNPFRATSFIEVKSCGTKRAPWIKELTRVNFLGDTRFYCFVIRTRDQGIGDLRFIHSRLVSSYFGKAPLLTDPERGFEFRQITQSALKGIRGSWSTVDAFVREGLHVA